MSRWNPAGPLAFGPRAGPAHTSGTGDWPILALAPGLALLVALSGLAYFWAWRRASAERAFGIRHLLAFLAGLTSLAVAFGGPIEVYSDDALAAHMVQHLVLLQIAPPLLFYARPLAVARQALPGLLAGPRPELERWIGRLLAPARRPWLVGLVFNLNLLVWHLPPAYDAALRSRPIHGAEHLLMLGSAMAFWWLVLRGLGESPGDRDRRSGSSHAVYGLCFASSMAGMLVALALIFSARPLYPWYAARSTGLWGMSALADQRLGGWIMFAGGLIYLVLLLRLLAREAGALDGAPASDEDSTSR